MNIDLLKRIIDDFNVNDLISFLGYKLSGFYGEKTDYSNYLNESQLQKYPDVYKIGETTLNGNEQIIAIVSETNDPLTERSGKKTQYEIAKTILKNEMADLAFFVFYDTDGNFRFSIIHIERNKDRANYTSFRRYTYYVSKEQTNKTFRDQIGNSNFGSIDEIIRAFSVEKLNKEFYGELSNWYFWAKDKVEFPDDVEKDKETRNAINVIRLITRLIFVWFLKQKKLIPNELFDWNKVKTIVNLSDKTGSTYYKAILQNLFFATLNTEMTENKRKFVNRQYGVQGFYRYERFFSNKERFLELTRSIPFLNGGLFENLDRNIGESNEIRIDCFSNRIDLETKLVVPDNLFFGETENINLNDAYGDKNHTNVKIRGIIDILKNYNFTIEENNPIEVEVALDPELLGKVFENLLASYNPETKTTARKQSGSFYTPREIVDYMCDESLFIYLKEATKGTISDEYLRELVAYNSVDNQQENVKDKLLLIEAIDKCKILDPACGSGAFPMGILQKMVFILQKLDHKNQQWKIVQEKRAREENKELIERLEKDKELVTQIGSLPEIKAQALKELEQRLKLIENAFTMSTNELDYARKLFLIENCIYGVDIQPIAIQISKLRFFISLLVEQEVKNEYPNRGIIPMPNMETKFVAANTLRKLNQPKQTLIKPQALYPLEVKLREVRHRHFSARTPETKNKYREEDEKLREQICKVLKESGFPHRSAEQIAEWDPYNQNTFAQWFDPEWMFGLTNGFDIVIGNPPYLRIQGIRETDSELADYLIDNYHSATGSFDYYTVFAERAISLVKKEGVVNFIMPVKWTNASFGKGIREVILKDKSAYKIISFVAYQVFNASTYTGLQWFKRNSDNLKYIELDKDLPSNQELDLYLRGLSDGLYTDIAHNKLSSNPWVLASGKTNTVLSSLEDHKRKLSDVFSNIFQGLATGKDDVFFLHDCKKENTTIKGYSKQLGIVIEIEKEIVRPLLKGDNVHKYDSIDTDKYVVFPYKIKDGKAILLSEENLKTYKLAYSYLKLCEIDLRNREKGRFNINGEWFQFSRKQGILLAEYEKLLSPYLSLGCNFAYDIKGEFYLTTKVYGFVKKKSILESYKFWLTILNSKILWYFISNTSAVFRGGYYVFAPEYVNSFPIPDIKDISIIKPFEILADYLLYLKSPDSLQVNPYVENKDLFPVFEEALNMMVYELYFEEHMKELEIDVLQFTDFFKSIEHLDNQEKANEVSKAYNWLQEKENPIRNRIILSNIRSKDIIRVINASI